MMHKRLGIQRYAVGLLLAVLLSVVPFSASWADDHDAQTIEEKVAQLEAELLGLRGLVKSLSVDIQKVADETNIDFGEFQPRLKTVEKVSKENTFEVKILKGSVAELSETVSGLEELRPYIYEAKTTIKELKAYFLENAEIFKAEIDGNEAQINELQEELRKAMIVVGVLEEQIAPISVRIDTLNERLQVLGADTDAIHAGLQRIANDNAHATEMFNGHINQLEHQIKQLEATLIEANRVSEVAAEIEVHISELSVRTNESEEATNQLAQFLDQFERFDGQARDMRGQIDQIGNQIAELAREAENNAAQIAQNASRMDRIEQMRDSESGEGEAESRLVQKINEAFLQFEATQGAIDELQATLASSREQIKREILSDMPRIPTTDEIVTQIRQSAAAQIEEANARANQAQNVALIALVTGLSAIAVSLVL